MHPLLTRRTVVWGLAASTLAAGCDDCDRPTPPPMPAISSRVKATQPGGAPLETAWKRASARLTVRQAPASDEPLRYQTPSCSLRYQLRIRTEHDVSEHDPPTGQEVVATLDVKPPKEGEAERGCTLSTRMLSNDRFSYGHRRPVTGGAPELPTLSVAIAERNYRELEGPTALWVAHASLPPLSVFFPELPESTRIGDTHKWHRKSMRPDIVAKLLAARSRHPDLKLPPPPTLTDEVELEVDKWLELTPPEGEPERAVMLSASWSVEDQGNDTMPAERSERWLGQFVIGAGGYVIHGMMIGNRHHWWSTRPGESASRRGRSQWEIGLVKGCGGPVVVPLSETLPPVPAQMSSAAPDAK